MLFRSGTTTIGDDVLHFHSSLFQPALLTRSDIQPVAIQYLGVAQQLAPYVGDDIFISHLIKMLCLDKVEVHVNFLPIINSSGRSRHAVSVETRNMILNTLSDLSTDYSPPHNEFSVKYQNKG